MWEIEIKPVEINNEVIRSKTEILRTITNLNLIKIGIQKIKQFVEKVDSKLQSESKIIRDGSGRVLKQSKYPNIKVISKYSQKDSQIRKRYKVFRKWLLNRY